MYVPISVTGGDGGSNNIIFQTHLVYCPTLLLQPWMISRVFVWIIPEERSLFWVLFGFSQVWMFFQIKIFISWIKNLFWNTSRDSVELCTKKVQGAVHCDQDQVALPDA